MSTHTGFIRYTNEICREIFYLVKQRESKINLMFVRSMFFFIFSDVKREKNHFVCLVEIEWSTIGEKTETRSNRKSNRVELNCCCNIFILMTVRLNASCLIALKNRTALVIELSFLPVSFIKVTETLPHHKDSSIVWAL